MLICFFIVVFHLNLIPSATFSAVRKAEWLDSVKADIRNPLRYLLITE